MDKSRQQFEGWINKNHPKCSEYHKDIRLEAWQASRESLEIELPERKGICHNEYESGYFDGIDKCEDILIRSGVKIKDE
ncbi:TPA: hypothetical protein ACKRJU_003078 [Proteus mirabilis]|uniref:hypothetical protein n=1 Tax=Proteus mirabilis TaxID=584 RepID=UPI0009ABC74D|nr:hypothetical protein [Proteus mirabilis]ARA24315.1 hypothetical protein AM438_18185 [Proteus mirabilis]EKV0742990.1 hypothetical protein [Proteus mirabilis]MBG3100319.1 hypothetical protein [Proteus mirabilis]MBG5966486.1 hypothetical protein [Proteus mirabilis]MDM3791546.1 hypothetical protein [Proteus mirabilis]